VSIVVDILIVRDSCNSGCSSQPLTESERA
jgi:hypothetical protein